MKRVLISIAILTMTTMTVNAESLFTLGATQNYAGVPRSLFGGVQAHQIGDLLSIIMQENITVSDNLTYSSEKSSNTVDTFTTFLNKWLGLSLKDSNGYGGSNEVSNSAAGGRSMTFGDKIAVQVVQQLPNGNLAVQGKKTLVNGNERMDFIVTGVVDPRWLNVDGEYIHIMYRIYSLHFQDVVLFLETRTKVYSTDLLSTYSSVEVTGLT